MTFCFKRFRERSRFREPIRRVGFESRMRYQPHPLPCQFSSCKQLQTLNFSLKTFVDFFALRGRINLHANRVEDRDGLAQCCLVRARVAAGDVGTRRVEGAGDRIKGRACPSSSAITSSSTPASSSQVAPVVRGHARA